MVGIGWDVVVFSRIKWRPSAGNRSYDIEVVDIRGSWRDDLFLALWALQGPALSLRTRKLNQNSLRLIGLMGRTRA